jgi:hypothetical protein
MNEPMKLIEGMKKLKVLEKKLDRNAEQIQMYASAPSNEKPAFGDEKEQKAKVQGLIQSSKDILAEYMELYQRVTKTNLITTVTIGTRTFKLVDLLVLRRGQAKRMAKSFSALNTSYADGRIASMGRVTQPGEKPPVPVRFYNESEKMEAMQDWMSLQDEIEQRLEVINATTDLVTV